MKFISQQNLYLEIPEKWAKKAKKVLLQLELLEDCAREYCRVYKLKSKELNELLLEARVQRKAIINRNSGIWAELKNILADQNHDKCWYCETIEIRSDKAVDHFRPKNNVAEDFKHGGYWWLAFCWKNYRYSCTLCNSRRRFEETEGGKQDNFPLFEPPKRAGIPGEEEREVFVLLDPCDHEDVQKITYNSNGDTISVSASLSSLDYKRVQKSVELYHLNHAFTCRARKKISQDIDFLVDTVNNLLSKKDNIKAKETQEKIINLVGRDSREAFSTSARTYLRKHTQFNWVKYILENF